MLSAVTVSTAAEQVKRDGEKESRIAGIGETLVRWRRTEVPKSENLEAAIFYGVLRRKKDVGIKEHGRKWVCNGCCFFSSCITVEGRVLAQASGHRRR